MLILKKSIFIGHRLVYNKVSHLEKKYNRMKPRTKGVYINELAASIDDRPTTKNKQQK